MQEPDIRLRQSIINGNLLVVKRLLKRFPDLLENIDPLNGWSSLHYAAFNGRYLICVHLISQGHDRSEVIRTFKHNTCVHLALMNGHEQTTHLLLQHFPKLLNDKGDEGLAPLHVCTIKDYFKCVEMLLVLGADINVVDDEGNNSLHLAMKYGSLQSIKILILNNIKVDVANKNNLKPMDVASSFEVESFYNNTLAHKDDDTSTDVGELTTPSFSRHSFSSNVSPVKDVASSPTPVLMTNPSTQGDSSFASGRSHSNSLPPLPSVTTSRRPSIATAPTRSPVPRSAISLGFNGSSSSSYVFSPTASTNNAPSLSIKPPSQQQQQIYTASSPVLYSPVSATYNYSTLNSSHPGNELITSSINEEGNDPRASSTSSLVSISNTLPRSASVGPKITTSHSVTSISSVSSGNSTKAQSTDQGRTRGFFPPSSKSRSNSHSNSSLRAGSFAALKFNNQEPSINNKLTRSSTANSDNGTLSTMSTEHQFVPHHRHSHSGSHHGSLHKEESNSSLLSSFIENTGSKFKIRHRSELNDSNASAGIGNGTTSILNVPISSFRRKAPSYDD